MRGSTRGALYACIAAMALMALLAAGSEMLSAFGLATAPHWRGVPVIAAACILGVLLAGWIAIVVVDGLFDDIERLRGLALSGRIAAGAVPRVESVELGRLVAVLGERWPSSASSEDEARLTAVLSAIDAPLLAITGEGQISLINHAARDLLGKVTLGSSLLTVLDRAGVLAALGLAAGTVSELSFDHVDGRRLAARAVPLPGIGGAVLRFSGSRNVCLPGQVEHDLRLHDEPPQGGFGEDTPLDRLPVLVLDCETTGLDVRSDRIVAIGGLRLHGGRSFPATRFEELVDPGTPIPARATAIHGIGDAMVKGAPRIEGIFDGLEARWSDAVIVGHNIGFDLAILREEAQRAGRDWQERPHLCTLLIAAALWPGQRDLNLEDVAARLQIDTHGRHTALGDAMVTAAIWMAMIPLLADAGVRTFAEAQAFAGRAKSVRRLQQAAGW